MAIYVIILTYYIQYVFRDSHVRGTELQSCELTLYIRKWHRRDKLIACALIRHPFRLLSLVKAAAEYIELRVRLYARRAQSWQ